MRLNGARGVFIGLGLTLGVTLGSIEVGSSRLGVAVADAGSRPPVCEPAGGRTVRRSRYLRIYEIGRGERSMVVGCHLGRRGATRLAAKADLESLVLAGRFVAVTEHRDEGDRLRVVDLLHGRRAGRLVRYDEGPRARGDIRRVRIDRGGVAAFVAVLPPEIGAAPVEVGSTASPGLDARGTDINPGVLGLAGRTVAWRRGATTEFAYHEDQPARTGTVAHLGELRVQATRSGRLVGLFDETRDRRTLGSVADGADGLQRAGRFVGRRSRFYSAGDSKGFVRVIDLRRRRPARTVCATPTIYNNTVASFVVSESGGVACAIAVNPTFPAPPEPQIVSEGTILDRGSGIDLGSLRREGDEIVWWKDGAPRRASLPSPPKS